MKQFIIKKSIAAVVAFVFFSVLCFSAGSPLPNLTDNKEILSNSEKNDLTDDKKVESTGHMIAKEGVKKSKKKFPTVLVLLGVLAVSAIIFAVSQKKSKDDPITTTGSIKITSTPSEASIWLDGVDTGTKTTSTLTNIATGPHEIILRKAGYDDFLQNIDVTAGQETQVNTTLVQFISGITWITIPAGEFMMGDNFNEGQSHEQPVHKVYLDQFQMAKYEVTFDQFDKFCVETNRVEPGDMTWGRGSRPVIHVSWDDAQAFCAWLSEKTGQNIHLPSEAQWEKAARGTDQRRYPWGNSAPNSNRCNFDSNSGKTRAVGSYPNGKSPYGIHDMAGNAWEWCTDWYSFNYYSNSPLNNPVGPSSGTVRILRGGGWSTDAMGIRTTNRDSSVQNYTRELYGIRLVKD